MRDLGDAPMEISEAEATEGRMNALRKGNFYTSAVIQPRRLVQTEFELKKVLIDAILRRIRFTKPMRCLRYKSSTSRLSNAKHTLKNSSERD